MELREHEVALAEAVGRARQAGALERGRPDRYGAEVIADPTRTHVDAAGGELAAAIAYRLPWTGCYFRDLGASKPADIGHGTEVRTRTQDWHNLIVHPEDEDGWCFVLVQGASPRYDVIGSIRGSAAKRREWWKDPAGGRPAFFVPQSALKLLEAARVAAA